MFEQKNGILYQDGLPVIALGVSYYPSFHESKFPVPPEGDRVGEMKTDLRKIREAGFNHIRTAAIGNTRCENEEVVVDTPFIDAMMKEAAENGLSSSIRLHGFVMNLRGFTDYAMRNERDEVMEYNWAAFLRSTFFHEGVMEDNRSASRALGRHFKDMPDVVSFQIYNEPHYPFNGIFDYHPLTIRAYRKWLVGQGLPEEDPPRHRPFPGESPEPWVRWRIFSKEALSRFLDDTAAATSEGAPGIETYTDMTSATIHDSAVSGGMSYFDNAKGCMDFLGITSYEIVEGMDAYTAFLQYALAESAAALHGKHAWNAEADARTRMPARKLYQEVYAFLAAGFKGINFYEWRGDYADPGSPHPDNCGFIFNDGRKTEHYDRSMEMIRFINHYSTMLALAEKVRDGAAILFSEHAIAYSDACSGSDPLRANGQGTNMALRQLRQAYRELRQLGFCPDFVQASDLSENIFGVRLLFVPCRKEWLSEEEQNEIEAFQGADGRVWYLEQSGTFDADIPDGWWMWEEPRLDTTELEFRGNYEAADVIEKEGLRPVCSADNRHLLTGTLEGTEEWLIFLINTDPARKDVSGSVLTLNVLCREIVFATPDGEQKLEMEDGKIRLPRICEGAMLILRK